MEAHTCHPKLFGKLISGLLVQASQEKKFVRSHLGGKKLGVVAPVILVRQEA
jgi:hypothetical protein